jgi:two-component system heavy metal sensor histidine kinase CusS
MVHFWIDVDMMKAPISLTARLSLLFAGSIALALLVAGMLFGRAVEGQFQKRQIVELDGKMEAIRDTLGNSESYESIAVLQPQLHNTIMAGHPHSAITIVGSDGTVLLSMGQPKVVRHLIEGAGRDISQSVTWSVDNDTYRIVSERVALAVPGSHPAVVAISLDITNDQEFISAFRQFLWFGIGLGSLAMGLLGWMAVRRGLSPLRNVSAMLGNVSTSQLDKPIPMGGIPRDLQDLISAFNKMLARLDDSFRRLSEFSSDIAHELRTPINNMMLQTQVALSRKRDSEEYYATLQSDLEELRRLSRMIEDMLFLANADNCLVVPKLEVTDLREEVAKLLDFFEIVASERQVSLVQSGAAPTVLADRLMIQRALSNLLSNALRFTPEGTPIEVGIQKSEGLASVTVANSGPEIPAEHLPKIFRRLYRIDASRREGDTLNVGLGLAITKSIVEIHGGTVSAESAKGRTCFTIALPLKPAILSDSERNDDCQGPLAASLSSVGALSQ